MGMTLVVMAAGRGSRFGGMKQVARIGPSGESLFDYSVYDAARSGFSDAVFVVSEASREAVKAHVDGGCGRHVDVRYVEQSTEGRSKPWGTGHALLCACSAIEGCFGVANADDFYGERSFAVLGRELAADHSHHVLVGFRLKQTLSPNGGVSRGVCDVEDGFLTSISELHDIVRTDSRIRSREGVTLTGDELISTNLWGFRLPFCETLVRGFSDFVSTHGGDPDAEFLIGDAVKRLDLDRRERVLVAVTPERFHGITYSEDLAGVQRGDSVPRCRRPLPVALVAIARSSHQPTWLWAAERRGGGRRQPLVVRLGLLPPNEESR